MIPRTFPSTFAANGQQQMVVYSLPSITGLTAWIDYIPVKGVTTESATLENTYANGGYQAVDSLASLTGKQAWLDYIPVYEDASYTKPWSTDAGGYIPTSALAALLLDFTSGRLDPRITFSRTTNATLTNSAGLVANAPMNLLTFSEQFDNAAWTKLNSTVTANVIAAPDGATTADKFVESATSGQHLVYRASAGFSGVTTLSIYAKAGERQFVFLSSDASATDCFFNLTTGQLGAKGASVSAQITSVGNGWYRCSITGALTGSAYVGVAQANGAQSYAGDGTSGIYIWGAQLELGSTATTYNPTTVKNLLGFTENFDNAAWTKSNAFVQTNLLTYSVFSGAVAGTPGTAPTDWPFVLSAGTTAVSGASLTLSVASPARHFISQSVTLAANTAYTFSINLTAYSGVITESVVLFNASAGSITGASSIEPSGGFGRRSLTITAGGAGATVNIRIGAGVNNTTAGATSVTFDSPQLVQGTSAGDYKATYAAAAAVGYTNIYGQPFAQKLVEDTANNTHFVNQIAGSVGSVEVRTIYAKAAERTWLYLGIGATSFAYFNLASGATGTVNAGTASITAVGDGWFRCSLAATRATNLNNVTAIASSNGGISYTGDGTSGIYIFGAQLSDSASIDPYVYQPVAAPTSTAYYGPRFDYDPVTLAPKGLLIEEQRTNLLTYSEQFDNAAWIKDNATVTANAVISPDGTVDADKLVENTATGLHNARQTATVTNISYAYSVYIKPAGRNFAAIECSGQFVYFDLVNGTIGFQNNATGAIQSVGNGWYRCTIIFTPSAGTPSFIVYPSTTAASGGVIYTGDGISGIYIWGAQLEAGSFATSYIPTVASQVTRAADSASMIGNNFARWYNGNTNTFYTEVSYYGQLIGSATETNGIYLNDGTVLNQVSVRTVRDLTAPQADVVVVSASSTQLDSAGLVPVLANTVYRRAFAYATNSALNCINGALDGSTSTPFVLPTSINKLSVPGTFTAMHIKRIAYYNRRLSNTELQGITS